MGKYSQRERDDLGRDKELLSFFLFNVCNRIYIYIFRVYSLQYLHHSTFILNVPFFIDYRDILRKILSFQALLQDNANVGFRRRESASPMTYQNPYPSLSCTPTFVLSSMKAVAFLVASSGTNARGKNIERGEKKWRER